MIKKSLNTHSNDYFNHAIPPDNYRETIKKQIINR
jgi:hypothetical protein